MAGGLIALFLFWITSVPAGAAPALQSTPQPTPTAGEDGRILYTVQAGDSQWLIAAKFNIDIQQLRILNNWTADDVLTEGQTVLLGLASEQPTAVPTEEPEATTEATPDQPGSGMICVLLFEDVNGDGIRQESEFGIANGALSVTERSGLASQQQNSLEGLDADAEPLLNCFEDLPAGEYTISVALPDGFNPTTATSASLNLTAGDETRLNFGAQLSSEARGNQLGPQEGGRSPLMGLLGIVMLLSGLGLGAYTYQLSRQRR